MCIYIVRLEHSYGTTGTVNMSFFKCVNYTAVHCNVLRANEFYSLLQCFSVKPFAGAGAFIHFAKYWKDKNTQIFCIMYVLYGPTN
jgi:hypothetical protein